MAHSILRGNAAGSGGGIAVFPGILRLTNRQHGEPGQLVAIEDDVMASQEFEAYVDRLFP
jgi:hypothetical protein